MDKLLDIAIKASYYAGYEITKVYNSYTKGARIKEDKSIVTDADINANKVIIDFLTPTNIPIVSEENISNVFDEDNSIRLNSNRIWMIDPLDGTSEFFNGGDEFTVNIALIENHEVVLGVVYVPITKELYFAHKGIGSYKYVGEYTDKYLERAIRLPYLKTEKYTIVASKLNINKKTKNFINQISKDKDVIYKNRSSSLKFCMVAEGSADIYPRFSSIKEWDTAAAHAIVKYAGKNVYTLQGKELEYNKKLLINPSFLTK